MAPMTAAQLQARIAQLQQQSMTPYFSGGGHMTAGDPNNTNRISQSQHDAAMAELASLQPQLSALQGGASGTQNRVDEARKNMYGLAQGRLDDLKGDPLDALISTNLQQMISGANAPYDSATTNSLITGATQGNADAAGAQYRSLLDDYVAGGGNPNDPAIQAERRSIENNRLGRNQDAQLGILQNANVQNYNARRGAMAQGAGFNSARNSAITNQANYLGNLYSHEYSTAETPGASYSFGSGNGGPLYTGQPTPGSYANGQGSYDHQNQQPTFQAWQTYSQQQPQQQYRPEPVVYGNSAMNFAMNAEPRGVPQGGAGPAAYNSSANYVTNRAAPMQVAAPPAFNPNWVYRPQDAETQRARLPGRAQQVNPNAYRES
jgi:hypothetical protein